MDDEKTGPRTRRSEDPETREAPEPRADPGEAKPGASARARDPGTTDADHPARWSDETTGGSREGNGGRSETRGDGRGSMTELLGRLGSETATLARLDMALVRSEMREKLEHLRRGGLLLAVGTAVLLVALLPLVETLVRGLTALFEGWIGLDVAVWLAPLVVALFVGAVGYGLIRAGTGNLREEKLIPEKTRDSLQRQKRWMQARFREMREEEA